MKNSLGFLILSLIGALFLLNRTNVVFAKDIISPEADLEYRVLSDSSLSLKINLALTNRSTSKTVVSQYIVPFPEGIHINDCKITNGILTQKNNIFTINFKKKGLNAGSTLRTTITCTLPLTQLKGFYAINVPLFISDIKISDITVYVPQSFGKLLMTNISFKSASEDGSFKIYHFNNQKEFVSLLFGSNFVYKFNISKEIKNEGVDKERLWEIPLFYPTDNKEIVYTKIEPLPTFTHQDFNGNIFLVYRIQPNSNLNLHIEGFIKKEADMPYSNNVDLGNFPKNSIDVSYWILKDSLEKKRVAVFLQTQGFNAEDGYSLGNLKQEEMIKAIENYILKRLSPASLKENSIESSQRGGATAVLNHLNNASPEDYADFTIALLRLYGFKTRMVEGIIADNKFLSVKDNSVKPFFNSWVEVWVNNKWYVIDPYLDDKYKTHTDWFNADEYNHIPFIVRTSNPLSPRIGFLTPNDIKLFILTTAPTLNCDLEIQSIGNQLKVKNSGNSILKSLNISSKGIIGNEEDLSRFIVPGETRTLYINKNYTGEINVTGTDFYGNKVKKDVNIDFKISSKKNSSHVINLFSFVVAIIIYTVILILINAKFHLWK